jgi:hypothetical protein
MPASSPIGRNLLSGASLLRRMRIGDLARRRGGGSSQDQSSGKPGPLPLSTQPNAQGSYVTWPEGASDAALTHETQPGD